MILEDVLEKAAYARPGYVLAAFKEAALPVFQLTARVTTLERKPISPIEEACLKALDGGLETPEEICEFLGLPIHVLKGVLAGLNAKEQINYLRPAGAPRAKVLLTGKGKLAMQFAATIQPDERIVQLLYDPIARRVVFMPKAALSRSKDVREQGWLEIPLCGAKRPEAEDIPLADIDKVVRRLAKDKDEIRELLAIRRIERRELFFTQALALYYRSNDGKDVQVGFYRDEVPAVEHELAFAEAGGPATIGAAHALAPQELPVLDISPGLTDQLKASLSEVNQIEDALKAAERDAAEASRLNQAGDMERAKASANQAKERLKQLTQRLVRCHEHPKLLREAINRSTERLLIISPWIRHQVMDDTFMASLESLLRKGVKVYIGYGLSEDGGHREKQPISRQAKEALEKLQKRFKNLTLKFVGNTHRKQLVSDDRFAVLTSFNWLSFRGDPKSRARDEAGYLFSDRHLVDDLFKDGLGLIEHGYDHPESAKHGMSG